MNSRRRKEELPKMHTSPIVLQQPPTVMPLSASSRPLHVAIISDGNGRWASSCGRPRSDGHRAGAQTARRIIAAAPGLGIHTLTLFALSSANWQRPADEVAALMRLMGRWNWWLPKRAARVLFISERPSLASEAA